MLKVLLLAAFVVCSKAVNLQRTHEDKDLSELEGSIDDNKETRSFHQISFTVTTTFSSTSTSTVSTVLVCALTIIQGNGCVQNGRKRRFTDEDSSVIRVQPDFPLPPPPKTDFLPKPILINNKDQLELQHVSQPPKSWKKFGLFGGHSTSHSSTTTTTTLTTTIYTATVQVSVTVCTPTPLNVMLPACFG